MSDPVTDDLVVRVAGGLVAGTRQSGVRAFLGLPFAAPPVGPLRWKAPQPVAPWVGVRDATRFAPQCPQPGRSPESVYAEYAGVQAMSEDCLYLNVWTAAQPGERRPVMVWIHGGAFQQGAGSNPVFVRGNLAEKGVVLVTFNYRLGPFGFFAHPELGAESADGSSGNCGLLDMAAALRWVQEHIEAFGGDPDNVTIFGQSAGADGVVELMASRRTQGLFARAIAQSFGVARQRTRAQAQSDGLALAARAGATSLAALRALDAEALLAAGLATGLRMMPPVDGHFIEEPVIETFAQGRQQAVPFIVGWNADEGSTFPAPSTVADLDAELERRFPGELERAGALYPAADDAEARRAGQALFGDSLFGWGAWRAACAQARIAPTWVYHFEHAQPFEPGQSWREAARASDLGVFHSSEYPYIFGSTSVLTRPWGEADAQVGRLMQSLWLSFARTGRAQAEGIEWPRFEDGRATVLRISTRPALGDVPRRAHLQFVDR